MSARLEQPPVQEPPVPQPEPPRRDPPPPDPPVRLRWLHRFGVAHLIVLPVVAMAVLLALARAIDAALLPALPPDALEAYRATRAMAIGTIMAVFVAWLAFRYRRRYEAELQARNAALEETRDFLSRIIEGSAEAIVTLDLEGRVTSWNRAAESIYGWSREEMIGQTVDRLAPSKEGLRELRRLQHLVHSGATVRDYESRRVRKDGKVIHVRVGRSPLYDASGALIGSTGTIQDVTAVKEIQAQLVTRERLAAVGELAAMVAHEVRNPLAGIRGGCEILLEGYAAGDSRHEIGEEILRQVDRLTSMVQELLAFARPRTPEPVLTNVSELIDRVLGLLQGDPRMSDVLVVRDEQAGEALVHLDPQGMEQVLINLVVNAAQAMNGRGTIRIATRLDDDWLEMAVADTGPGIPTHLQESIFNPFFTTKTQGTGLGLSIVASIVASHHGTVTAGTAAGGGAELTVRLPRRVSA